MPSFTYKAKDKQGQVVSGTLEAETRASVISRLQGMGYFPMDIRGAGQAKGAGLAGAIQKSALFKAKVKTRNLTMFYRQMSDLVGAGVPLVKSLGIVKSQAGDPALATLIGQVDRDVQSGDTLARAMDRHPKVFNKLTTAMIHAGETGGLLEEVLARLADFAESEEEMKAKIKGALAYPVIMSLAGSVAVGVLITFVIPKIVGVFNELNQTLPVITQILLKVTGFLSSYWYMILLGIALVILMLQRYRKTAQGKLQFDRFILRLPVLGEVVLKREVARFTQTLGALLRNGVPILAALEIASEVMGNAVIRREIKMVPEGIAEGKGISGTLRNSVFFPPVVINMIAIGEETGNLPGVLLKVAKTYEAQVDRSVKTLTSIIEPIIILVMGLVVGFIVISMLLPIFELDPSGG